MVITWMLKSMNSTIRQSVIWINTTREIWEDLEQRYDRGDSYRLSDLLESFHTLKQDSLTIDEYFIRLKILWDEIIMSRPIPVRTCNPTLACTCDIVKIVRNNVDSERVMKFVEGLNDSFEYVRSKVLMEVPLPGINDVFNMTINHERQQSCGTVQPQVMLYSREC